LTAIDTSRDSITIVKSFTYRGNAEVWSNTYFMDGTTPSSAASWKVLADAVIADEVTCYDSGTEVVKAIGHVAGESVAVWSYDYEAASETVPGTFSHSSFIGGGDTAVWVRWKTTALTERGKPIYLRSYFHPAYGTSATDQDTTNPFWITAAEAYAADWVTGFVDGDGHEHHRAGPHGVSGQLPVVASPFTTTRTLERRGRRPTTP
jgi:hypothetical protein